MPSSTGGKQIMPYKNLPLSFFFVVVVSFFFAEWSRRGTQPFSHNLSDSSLFILSSFKDSLQESLKWG